MYDLDLFIRCARKSIQRGDYRTAIVHLVMGNTVANKPQDMDLLLCVADEIPGEGRAQEVKDRIKLANIAYAADYWQVKFCLQNAENEENGEVE